MNVVIGSRKKRLPKLKVQEITTNKPAPDGVIAEIQPVVE